jgi:anti-sigma factor RsiW
MAACADQELLLGGLIDGELDAANTAMVEAHVTRCAGCREELNRLQAVRNLLHMDGVRNAAPEQLLARIQSLPELSERPPESRNRLPGWLAPGVAGALAASLAMVTFTGSMQQQVAMDDQIISGHVRSLQAGHLIDVQTSSQHVVKPWFNGRIDFAPPVPDLADAGFPLVGGRLDSLEGRTVPVIVYKRRLHTVNLFVWEAKDSAERHFVKDGFAVREWSRDGTRFAAVSDIPAAELQQFEALFVKRAG